MPRIELVNVSVYYTDTKKKEMIAGVLDVTFTLPPKSLTAIVGPSGCGKTTLIKAIAGIIKPDNGFIYYNNIDVTNVDVNLRNIGFIDQNSTLYPNKTVYENIAYPLQLANVPIEEQKIRVSEIAKQMGLSLLLSRKPKQLSGGEKQLVVIAKALIKKPVIVFLDEPFANLDSIKRKEMLTLLKTLHNNVQCNFIIVTHNTYEAYYLADIVVSMDNGTIASIEDMKESKSDDRL